MSDPRDELLDRIQEELRRIPAAVQSALYDHVTLVDSIVKATDLSKFPRIDALLIRAAGLALGQCVGIAETLVLEIEQHKRARAKTGSG